MRKLGVIFLTLLLAYLPLLGANTPLGKVVPRLGNSLLNGTAVSLETTVFPGDMLTTEFNSLAVVQLSYGDQIHLGPASSLTVNGENQQVVANLERGMTIVRSGNGRQVSVSALGLLVEPTGLAKYTVTIHEGAVYVSSDEGSVEVRGTNESFVVPTGKAMKFELAASTAPGPVGAGARNISPGVAAAIAIGVSLGVSLPIAIVLADNAEDDAREDACNLIKSQISPASAGAGITCQ